MSYYYAYGSNLDLQQMKRRCPHASEVGTGMVYGWALRFVGWSSGWGGSVADIERCHGEVVAGVVYELPFAELTDRMDRFEGCPTCYQRIRINVRLASGRALRCWTYVKVGEPARGVPSAEYFTAIWYGYESRGLDVQLLIDAVGLERIQVAVEPEQHDWREYDAELDGIPDWEPESAQRALFR